MTRLKEANQLASQIRALKVTEKEMKEEREAFIRENEERMARRKAYIRSLEQEIGRCEKSIHDTKTKTQANFIVIQSLVKPLQNLHEHLTAKELTTKLEKFLPTPSYFANINNDETKTAARAIKGDAEATPQQALHWMGFIEQRTTEIVQFYQAHLNSQRGKNPRTPSRTKSTLDDINLQRGPSAPSGKLREHLDASIHKIMSITSNRPKNNDDNVGGNNSEKPLSHSELKAQALHELKGLK